MLLILLKNNIINTKHARINGDSIFSNKGNANSPCEPWINNTLTTINNNYFNSNGGLIVPTSGRVKLIGQHMKLYCAL